MKNIGKKLSVTLSIYCILIDWRGGGDPSARGFRAGN